MSPGVHAALLIAALACTASMAHADPAPRGPRVLHAPTAWVLPRDTAWASAGASHRGDRGLLLTASLAGLAEVELGVADQPACAPCPAEATFKLGAQPGAWFRGMPAVALGVRRGTAVRRRPDDPGPAVYLAASAPLGQVRLHGGVTAWQRGIRPFAGLEWTPPLYPRTTVLADVAWRPAEAEAEALRWIGGWGVRYQAFAWGSIELAVRHRQDEALGDATVLVRVNGVVRVR